MNKVSAQQIRSLERRIARLEREAGVIGDIINFAGKGLKTPKNILNKILGALKDLGMTVLTPINSENIKAVESRIGIALAIRISGALTSGSLPSSGAVKMVEFNLGNPIKSLFLRKNYNGKDLTLPLDEMINTTFHWERGLEKRLKAAYLSWKSDYGHIAKDLLEIKSGKSNVSNEGFLKVLKRTSKMLYRLFKAFFDLAPIAAAVVLASTPWSTFISFFIFITKNPIGDLFDSLTRNISLGFPGLPPHLAAGAVGMASFLLNLIEKAFYNYGVNVDAFDAESAGKTASSHPRVASVVRLLESHV